MEKRGNQVRVSVETWWKISNGVVSFPSILSRI